MGRNIGQFLMQNDCLIISAASSSDVEPKWRIQGVPAILLLNCRRGGGKDKTDQEQNKASHMHHRDTGALIFLLALSR